jgi:hypothetical protein
LEWIFFSLISYNIQKGKGSYMERLVDADLHIAKSRLVCGGYRYALEGTCVGLETFGRFAIRTTIFPEPRQLKIAFVSNGNSLTGGDLDLFSGAHQPYSLWKSVTVYATTDLAELSEFLTKHGVSHEFTENTLSISSPGHFVCVMAASYLNGLSFAILKERELVPGERVEEW